MSLLPKGLLGGLVGAPGANLVLSTIETFESQRPDRLRIMTYHRIENECGFREQMEFLAARYEAVSVTDVLAAVRGERTLSPRAVLLTFDDAYRDFARCAWPILRRLRLPAVLFVPTAYPDRPENVFWWDRLEQGLARTRRRATLELEGTDLGPLRLATEADRRRTFVTLRRHVKTLEHDAALALVWRVYAALGRPPVESRVSGWDELRRLATEGVALAPHTRTHPLLNRVSPATVREEVRGSVEDLLRETGSSTPIFAYPSGHYDAGALAAVRDAGIDLAVTTCRGTNDLRSCDPLRLRRINIGHSAGEAVLRVRMLESRHALNTLHDLPTAT